MLIQPRYINVSVHGLLNPPPTNLNLELPRPEGWLGRLEEKIKKQLDVLETQGYTVVIDTTGVNNMGDMSNTFQKIIDLDGLKQGY